jgi:hypothetical protein
MSTLTVAIPNGISLVSAWFGRVKIELNLKKKSII